MKSEYFDIVSVREFRLVDAEGNLRARIGTTSEGDVSITLTDRYGKPRAEMGLTVENIASLQLSGADGSVRIALGLESEGAMIRMNDAFGQSRLVMQVDPSGMGMLRFFADDEWRSLRLHPDSFQSGEEDE